MAACMKGVKYIVSIERNAFLTRGSGCMLEAKRFLRGLRRRPVKVLFPETDEDFKATPKPDVVKQSVSRDRTVEKVATAAARLKENVPASARTNERSSTKQTELKNDDHDALRFERAHPGDKRLARLASVARSRTFREHQGKILLEGRRLICDALDAGANPQMVFFSTADRLRELPLDKLKRATLVKVKFEDIKMWSDVVAPQGVIAIFARPDPSRLNFPNRGCPLPLSLICDNIRDPGNLGTMLRCAAAAGCHDVLLTKGCVDVWEPKVLRAGMGAHFRLPIYSSMGWNDIERHLSKGVTVYVADSSCGTDRSNEAVDRHDAGSQKPSKAGDYGWISTRSDRRNVNFEDYDSDCDSDSEDEGPLLPILDSTLYHQTWARTPTAVVIGGETHGLSQEAVQLAEKTTGRRLFIPVTPGVDSLNSAMAASVLLFEGRKQLMQSPEQKSKPKVEKKKT